MRESSSSASKVSSAGSVAGKVDSTTDIFSVYGIIMSLFGRFCIY